MEYAEMELLCFKNYVHLKIVTNSLLTRTVVIRNLWKGSNYLKDSIFLELFWPETNVERIDLPNSPCLYREFMV